MLHSNPWQRRTETSIPIKALIIITVFSNNKKTVLAKGKLMRINYPPNQTTQYDGINNLLPVYQVVLGLLYACSAFPHIWTITHEKIIQVSFITAYVDIVPDKKVTFLAILQVWSEQQAWPKVPCSSFLMAPSWCWYSYSRQSVR